MSTANLVDFFFFFFFYFFHRKREWEHLLERGVFIEKKYSMLTMYIVFHVYRDESFFTLLNSHRCDCFHENLSHLGVTYPYTDSHLLKTYFSKLSQRNIITRRKTRLLSSGKTVPKFSKLTMLDNDTTFSNILILT